MFFGLVGQPRGDVSNLSGSPVLFGWILQRLLVPAAIVPLSRLLHRERGTFVSHTTHYGLPRVSGRLKERTRQESLCPRLTNSRRAAGFFPGEIFALRTLHGVRIPFAAISAPRLLMGNHIE